MSWKPRRPRPRLDITPHARSQMRARNVTRIEVGLVVDEPDESYPSGAAVVYRRRNLAVVLAPGWTVVTVLLRTHGADAERWDDVDVRTRDLLPAT